MKCRFSCCTKMSWFVAVDSRKWLNFSLKWNEILRVANTSCGRFSCALKMTWWRERVGEDSHCHGTSGMPGSPVRLLLNIFWTISCFKYLSQESYLSIFWSISIGTLVRKRDDNLLIMTDFKPHQVGRVGRNGQCHDTYYICWHLKIYSYIHTT